MILKILLFIWQLPQNLCGLLVIPFLFPVEGIRKNRNGVMFWKVKKMSGAGLSLGQFVFIESFYDLSTIRHEYGHAVQSILLGPLYLFVIGIPSLIHFWVWDEDRSEKPYTAFFTERWAEKLGAKYQY